MSRSKYYTDEQTQGCTDQLISMVDMVIDILGFKLGWNDGFRTPEHNAAVGGKPNSPHLTGQAVDLQAMADPLIREKCAWAFGLAGFRNVESAPHHFHLSCSPNSPQNAYYAGTDN
jgi:hypothetical protein